MGPQAYQASALSVAHPSQGRPPIISSDSLPDSKLGLGLLYDGMYTCFNLLSFSAAFTRFYKSE